MSETALFPLFLKLAGKRVLVVGGGPVALEKSRALLNAGARVHVVATVVGEAFAELDVTVETRAFRESDVDDAFLIVAAAPPAVNRDVQRAGDAAHRFVIAVDDPDACTAYGAATLERGGVTIAFSSSGRAPSLVTLLRRAVDAILPTELEAWRLTAESLRARLKAQGVPLSQRTPLLLSALNALHAERPRAWSDTASIQNGGGI